MAEAAAEVKLPTDKTESPSAKAEGLDNRILALIGNLLQAIGSGDRTALEAAIAELNGAIHPDAAAALTSGQGTLSEVIAKAVEAKVITLEQGNKIVELTSPKVVEPNEHHDVAKSESSVEASKAAKLEAATTVAGVPVKGGDVSEVAKPVTEKGGETVVPFLIEELLAKAKGGDDGNYATKINTDREKALQPTEVTR